MIRAVILAAGHSRRMGRPKLLLPLGGQPLINRVVTEIQRALPGPVWVVVGREAEGIREALAARKPNFVLNPDDRGDMLSSVRCGLRALPGPWEAVLIATGDQPGLASAVVASLVEGFQAGHRGLLVPTHRGRRGHPILIARKYREEILEHHDSAGLRGLLAAHPEDVGEVAVEDPDVLEDMDLPEDYARIARRFGDCE